MQLLGFKLNGEVYKSLFTKEGDSYIADIYKGKVRISKMSSINGELTLTLPLEINVEDFWVLNNK